MLLFPPPPPCLRLTTCVNSTVADVYAVHERGNALGIYFTGQFAGPLFGPIFGGFLVERWGWPSVFWLLFVIGCILLLLVVFTMEETYRDESIWGKEYDANKQFDPDEKSDNTVVADKMVNPLASLVGFGIYIHSKVACIDDAYRPYCDILLSSFVLLQPVSLLVACSPLRICSLICTPTPMHSVPV